jgi:lipid II:glycine glycyltransferase (peptidoglycan interpeptide bridge formation enzyme)
MSITVRRWTDPPTWNAFVSSEANAHFQQSWEWGELAPDLGGTAHRLAALDGDRMVGAMQVFANPIWGTGSTHLYVPRGPAVLEPSVEVLGSLFDAARRLGGDVDALGIRVEPNAASCNAAWKSALRATGMRPAFPPSQPRSSWMLDVTRDEESLLSNMKQKTRYNVRLASRKGVEIVVGGSDDEDDFYALFHETADRDDFFVHGKAIYERMFAAFRATGNFCMLLARHGGRLIAAITLIRFGSTCWYVHGASSGEHRNLMATYLLQWNGIQQAKRWGCSLYDFRAIPDVLRDDQDMYGVYRFKEGFGGYQFTTLHTHAAPYRHAMFGLWQLWFRARFELRAQQRRWRGLPARQFA